LRRFAAFCGVLRHFGVKLRRFAANCGNIIMG
jgi:hypothetical protein